MRMIVYRHRYLLFNNKVCAEHAHGARESDADREDTFSWHDVLYVRSSLKATPADLMHIRSSREQRGTNINAGMAKSIVLRSRFGSL
jgi:hypothetical protein